MSEAVPLERWLDAAFKATEEVAETSLACAGLQRSADDDGRKNPFGAYVPVHADKENLHVGLLVSEDGCRSLTRSLLCMEPEEEDPSEDMIADAVGEIVNVLAGIMQRDLVGEIVNSFELGLPIFVAGSVVPNRTVESAKVNVGFDDVPAQLVVLRHATG